MRPAILILVLLLAVASHAQKRESLYRSDGKNTFTFAVYPGYDKFSHTFGLAFEGAYSRALHPRIDLRVFQRFHRMVDERVFPDSLVLNFIHSYVVSGIAGDFAVAKYEKFAIKLSAGPLFGYAYKIRLREGGNKEPYDKRGQLFGGFTLSANFEAYPAKKIVLGLRFNYDQWFWNSDGYGNIYPGPYVGVRF